MDTAILTALAIAPRTLAALLASLRADCDLDADSFEILCALDSLRAAGLVARSLGEYSLV